MLTNEPKIEMVATAALIPYARNAKRHDEAQVAKLAGSIREYGFTNPVLIDADNGIIAGHGRVLGAQKLGLADVPCIRLSHLTETQKRAYVLADNRLAEIGGGWDVEMLRIEVEELREAGVDLDGIGLDAAALAELTSAFDAKETGMPELPEGDKQPFQQKTFTLHDEQAEEVDAACAKAKSLGHGESAVNENSNGNALAFVCQSFNRANP